MNTVFEGDLARMQVVDDRPVAYRLGEHLEMNSLLGRCLALAYTGRMHCRICGRECEKLYGEGYCYPHFRADPANAPCVVRPELCEAHEGRGRDPAWESAHHDQPHVVYLANSGGLKVGVTREANLPTRWIDQGAAAAIELARTPYRQLAGRIEVVLKSHVSDRTRWRRMLTGSDDPAVDLLAARDHVAALLEPELAAYLTSLASVREFVYPELGTPNKLTTVSLSKAGGVTGRLVALRGQYLVFEDGRALNVRRHTGFEVRLELSGD